jgi:hypothetical protein
MGGVAQGGYREPGTRRDAAGLARPLYAQRSDTGRVRVAGRMKDKDTPSEEKAASPEPQCLPRRCVASWAAFSCKRGRVRG